ncbi:MAG: hypothetical protein RhofKO_16830 [Rhodothermales bacterium]
MMLRTTQTVLGLMLACVLAASPVLAQGSGVTVTQSTSYKLPGMLGDAMAALGNRMPGGMNQDETLYLKGNQMRIDRGDETIVYDLDQRRMVTWNRATQRYRIQTFDQLAQQFEQLRGQASGAMDDASASDYEPVTEENYGFRDARLDLRVNRTGQTDRKNRFNAERVVLTMEATKVAESAEAAAEEGMDGTPYEMDGGIVAVTDMWVSNDVGDYTQVQAFQQRLAGELGAAFLGEAASNRLSAAFDRDPRMASMMNRMMGEATQVDGVPVHTTTHLVWVPQGQAFNESAVLELAKKKRRRGLGNMVRRALETNTGLNAGAEDENQQRTLVSVVNEIRSVESGTLEDQLFMPPSGFQEEAGYE